MNPIEHITVRPRQRDHVVVEPSVFREFGIRRGIPPKEDEVIEAVNDGKLYYFTVPRNPHVMFAKRIEFVANDESQHVIERGMVMLGHGVASTNLERDWEFRGTGKNVSATVAAYEAYAKAHDLPPLDAIIVCREYTVTQAGIVFETRGIPYIHGEGRVIIPAAVRRGQLFTNGGGIENMVVTASKWDGIDRWRGYWDHAMEHRSTRQIPGWAKQAATNS